MAIPTLLEICTRAVDEISSIDMPTYIVGNTSDDTAKQLLAIAKKVGEELVRDYEWQELDGTGTIVTANGVPSYATAVDFDRLTSDTFWDADNSRKIWGAISKSAWAARKNSSLSSSTYAFRLSGGRIELSPTPAAIVNMNYAYQSSYYCQDSVGTPIAGWTNDTDTPRLPADLMIAGVKYYFLKGNNLPYGGAEADYDGVIASRQAKNTPGGAIDMGAGNANLGRGRSCRPNFPDRVNV